MLGVVELLLYYVLMFLRDTVTQSILERLDENITVLRLRRENGLGFASFCPLLLASCPQQLGLDGQRNKGREHEPCPFPVLRLQ